MSIYLPRKLLSWNGRAKWIAGLWRSPTEFASAMSKLSTKYRRPPAARASSLISRPITGSITHGHMVYLSSHLVLKSSQLHAFPPLDAMPLQQNSELLPFLSILEANPSFSLCRATPVLEPSHLLETT